MDPIVKNYESKRANEYDNESEYDKGDRQMHDNVLIDIITYTGANAARIVELGCGTGFFTKTLVEKNPSADMYFIDGSADMLEIARSKVGAGSNRFFIQEYLQEIDWDVLKSIDIVFSALTIHHLTDEEKGVLYEAVYNSLNAGGSFIYFDQFLVGNEGADLLLEYLSCRDMQRRLRGNIPDDFYIKELSIEEIIKKDRKVKSDDGDKESVFSQSFLSLSKAGFSSVVCVFQEARYFGIVATK